MNALLRVGARGNEGDIYVVDNNGDVSIHLDGGSGDIVLKNADCAEEFDCGDRGRRRRGRSLSLREDGGVGVSERAYDTRVAGVVSGRSGYRPVIVLGAGRPRSSSRVRVALAGRVACPFDAASGPCASAICWRRPPGQGMRWPPRPGLAQSARSSGRLWGRCQPAPDSSRCWSCCAEDCP